MINGTHSVPYLLFGLNYRKKVKRKNKKTYRIRIIVGVLLAVCIFAIIPFPDSKTPRSERSRASLFYIKNAICIFQDESGQQIQSKTKINKSKYDTSWRVLLLPYLDNKHAFDTYDKQAPWNSDHNLSISHVDAFTDHPETLAESPHDSLYVGVVDESGDWVAHLVCNDDLATNHDYKIMIIETAKSNIHWMEPRDYIASSISEKIGDKSSNSISSRYQAGAYVLMADGSLKNLHPNTSPELIRKMLGTEVSSGDSE